MLRVVFAALSLTAVLATSTSPYNSGMMRLRGGADFKDRATGILFPENLKAGGSTLQVCSVFLMKFVCFERKQNKTLSLRIGDRGFLGYFFVPIT